MDFAAPAERIVLLALDAKALLVWRKPIWGTEREGVNCAAFRNEGSTLAHVLIREAEGVVQTRWPSERRPYTYVNAAIHGNGVSAEPFKAAGWRECGIGRAGLVILKEFIGLQKPSAVFTGARVSGNTRGKRWT